MSSTIKSWLYADTLEKPEELVMYRQRKFGGLGVHHLESKAMAMLIKSFLETSINDKFRRNVYHEALFNWHILGHRNITNPGFPSFFPKNFFSIIAELYEGRRQNFPK